MLADLGSRKLRQSTGHSANADEKDVKEFVGFPFYRLFDEGRTGVAVERDAAYRDRQVGRYVHTILCCIDREDTYVTDKEKASQYIHYIHT